MTERRERIPADEVKDSKRWNLPFWTEPNHVVHKEEVEEPENVFVEEEDIEVEPLTAEQLEAIRQEAYNEGLEQGLIEGRQKGEKLGYDDGFIEGKTSGETEGKKLGYDAGFEQGEKEASEKNEQELNTLTQRYESILTQIQTSLEAEKAQLSEQLPTIIAALAQGVIGAELTQGSEHIVGLVNQAISALPTDSGDVTIEVNPLDVVFVETALEQGQFEGNVVAQDAIDAGGCRVKTRYSAIDFTLSERWQTIEKQYLHQIQLSLKQQNEPSPVEASSREEANLDAPANAQNPQEDPPQASNESASTDVDQQNLNTPPEQRENKGDHEPQDT